MAYFAMMTARLVALRRELKPAGSLFLHCDASASHYLNVVLDQVMFEEPFRNEIVWKRSAAKSLMTRRLPTNHDVILFYSGDANFRNGEEALRFHSDRPGEP